MREGRNDKGRSILLKKVVHICIKKANKALKGNPITARQQDLATLQRYLGTSRFRRSMPSLFVSTIFGTKAGGEALAKFFEDTPACHQAAALLLQSVPRQATTIDLK
jgi:hypothetical protein